MSTYEYECLDCDNVFDKFQKITDLPLTDCPKCGGRVQRVISGGSGFILKGEGWPGKSYKKKEGGE